MWVGTNILENSGFGCSVILQNVDTSHGGGQEVITVSHAVIHQWK
jgi:hypothetical protein